MGIQRVFAQGIQRLQGVLRLCGNERRCKTGRGRVPAAQRAEKGQISHGGGVHALLTRLHQPRIRVSGRNRAHQPHGRRRRGDSKPVLPEPHSSGKRLRPGARGHPRVGRFVRLAPGPDAAHRRRRGRTHRVDRAAAVVRRRRGHEGRIIHGHIPDSHGRAPATGPQGHFSHGLSLRVPGPVPRRRVQPGLHDTVRHPAQSHERQPAQGRGRHVSGAAHGSGC